MADQEQTGASADSAGAEPPGAGAPPTGSATEPGLVPARMLNEYAYCPRLAYLEWVQGEFADNAFTLDGERVHQRVDSSSGSLPEPSEADGSAQSGEAAPTVARSVTLSAEQAGLIAKIDLIEAEGDDVVPVDYKRSRKPDVAEGAWEPERVQLCAQGIILCENGYRCERGILYFAGSRQRVEVRFDSGLVERTMALVREMRRVAEVGTIPPPLDDSPKCNGCSLVGICLPDEVGFLCAGEEEERGRRAPRRLVPARDEAMPVYVQGQGLFVGKSGDQLVVKERGQKVSEARLFETSQLNLVGNVQLSSQALRELCGRGIPICHFSTGGWFFGMTRAETHKNVELRIAQHRAFADPTASLALAQRFVEAKIRNCRTLLRRNAEAPATDLLDRLRRLARRARHASGPEELLGFEGTAARLYFEAFPAMLKREGLEAGFSFEGRNRRPPRDPVNAMLSLAYALLTKDLVVATTAAGFDPYLGFYHRPRYGRPALALDLMEEFRPLVADSVVIGAVNNLVVAPSDFVRSGGAVALKDRARRAFIAAYERRMDQLVRHPVFGYQVSYRQVLSIQARLLGRHLLGEIDRFPMFLTR